MAEKQAEDKDKMVALEEELTQTRALLHTTQRYLQDEQAKHNQVVMGLKLELYQTQTNLKQQQSKSDKQLGEVIGHLLYLEGRLKKERVKVKSDIMKRSKLIEEQRKHIEKLRTQNDQLLNAVKELYAFGGMNGIMRDCTGSPQNGRNNVKGQNCQKQTNKSDSEIVDPVWKHRGSFDLSSLDANKSLLENDPICDNQDELHREDNCENIPRGDNLDKAVNDRSDNGKGEDPFRQRCQTVSGYPVSENNRLNNVNGDMNGKVNGVTHDTTHNFEFDLNNTHDTSGLSAASDVSLCDISINDRTHTYDLDEDDGQIFSFSSTHIDSVIAEEEGMDPPVMHSGQMITMGSMPMLSNIHDPGHMLYSVKNRPHSLSSVDLNSIQQQAQKLAKMQLHKSLVDSPTPPASPSSIKPPSFNHGSTVKPTEKTAFQSFRNMFHRRGSKNKGNNKKRSVSLSHTTNKEYTEAMKKHFQKYDMS